MFEPMKHVRRRLTTRSHNARSRRRARPLRVEPLEGRALLAYLQLVGGTFGATLSGKLTSLFGTPEGSATVTGSVPAASALASDYPCTIVQDPAYGEGEVSVQQGRYPFSSPTGPDSWTYIVDSALLRHSLVWSSQSALDFENGGSHGYTHPVLGTPLAFRVMPDATDLPGDLVRIDLDETLNLIQTDGDGNGCSGMLVQNQDGGVLGYLGAQALARQNGDPPGVDSLGYPIGYVDKTSSVFTHVGDTITVDTNFSLGYTKYGSSYYGYTSGVASFNLDVSVYHAQKPTLTVSVGNAEREYGQDNPAFAISYSGFTGGDTPSSLGGSLVLTDPATATSDPGNYTVTAGGLTSDKYDIVYVPGTLTVDPAHVTTSVSPSDNPSVYGQAVQFTAVVTPRTPGGRAPDGYVEFDADGVELGTETLLDGVANYTASSLVAQNFLGVGTHVVTAKYIGDVDYLSGIGSYVQTVLPANTEVHVTSSAPLGSTYGGDVTFTAAVSVKSPGAGFPSGEVNFYDGDTLLGSGTIDAGVATFHTNLLHAGPHPITAQYVGDGDFNGGRSDPIGQTVRKALTQIIGVFDTASVYGQNLRILPVVTAFPATPTRPSGDIDLLESTTPIADDSLDDSGAADLSQDDLPAGHHVLTVLYLGDDDFEDCVTELIVDVARAPLTVTANPARKVYGQDNPAFSASFSGFVLRQGPGDLGGTLTFTTPATAAGHVVAGGYPVTPGGLTSSNYAIAFVPGTLTVTPAPLTVTADNATKVYGAADPALRYRVTGGRLIGSDQISGTPSRAPGEDVGDYPIGQGTLTAGDDYTLSFVGATLSITQALTATTLVASVNPAVVGQTVRFTVSVATIAPGRGVPTGTVWLMDGGTVIGSGTLSNGVVTFSTSSLAAGPHSITAAYLGSTNFRGSPSTAVTETVLTASQQVAVTQGLVRSYVDSGVLAANAASPLLSQLDNAAASLSRGDTTAGVNQLNASMNSIDALIASNRLRRTQGQPLLDAIRLAIGAV